VILSIALFSLSLAMADTPWWDSPAPGQIQTGLSTGFPWHGVDVAYAPRGEIALTGTIETARFTRFEARAGLLRPWRIGQRWSLVTEASAGGIRQIGHVQRQGPQLEVQLSVSRLGRVQPYLSLHDRELLSVRTQQVETVSDTQYSRVSERLVSRGGAIGLRIPIQSSLCLDLGLHAGSMDGAFAIPSVSLGLDWRPKT
jgi:hypothetical protein